MNLCFHNWRIDNPFVGPSEMALCFRKSGTLHYVIRYMYNIILAKQMTESCVALIMGTCKVWCNVLSRICRRIERHFKCSVDMLIMWPMILVNGDHLTYDGSAEVFPGTVVVTEPVTRCSSTAWKRGPRYNDAALPCRFLNTPIIWEMNIFKTDVND